MKKSRLIKALESFNDDDHIIIGDELSVSVPEIEVICGGRQDYMPYYCVLAPNHDGDCYCGHKHVRFKPDVK